MKYSPEKSVVEHPVPLQTVLDSDPWYLQRFPCSSGNETTGPAGPAVAKVQE
jgi:hypothetical protein